MGALVTNLGAFVTYTVVSSITPGPNNLMQVNVGVTRGHLAAARTGAGISLGWAVQVLACGSGLGVIVSAVPGLRAVLEAAGLAYLCWLAWRLAGARRLAAAAPAHGFVGALAYQWVNPKAISMSLSIAALFVVHSHGVPVRSIVFVGCAAAVLNYPCVCTWGVLGSSLARHLHDERRVVRFNRITALGLLAMVAWVGATASW